MVLKTLQVIADKFFPYRYTTHLLAVVIALAILRAFSQGRKTNRERDLHGRTFLVTGPFTPLGITLLQSLASRGAKIIALTQHPIDSPKVTILIDLLRTTFKNEHIYAEQCNLQLPSDIHKFCTRFLTEGDEPTKDAATATIDKRIDGIIFAHEYQHIGLPKYLRTNNNHDDEKLRESNALATFLIITLLLPVLLVAPVERDIRIMNVVNPFYAAASTTSTFDPTFNSKSPGSIFLNEGRRSLRTIILTRHLQRIFDALPKPQVPKTEEGSSTIPVISARMQRSNIVAVSVSPGISRSDTISPLLNSDWSMAEEKPFSRIGVLLYIIILPILHIFTKSPKASIQSILHALFLPTPFKVLTRSSISTTTPPDEADKKSTNSMIREEVLKPGALYSECAVVKLKVSVPPEQDEKPKPKPDEKGKGKDKGLQEEVLQIEDDGEYGGELAGRLVWEAYEKALKIWEQENK